MPFCLLLLSVLCIPYLEMLVSRFKVVCFYHILWCEPNVNNIQELNHMVFSSLLLFFTKLNVPKMSIYEKIMIDATKKKIRVECPYKIPSLETKNMHLTHCSLKKDKCWMINEKIMIFHYILLLLILGLYAYI